ncbi:MAG: LPS biosynthesis protein WbpP [Acidobacteria bacterium]|nr:MAG: LPS biosynthesis protein WbpP [Acidobacteriota bacterium]
MKILVTGGAGFIGSHLAQALVADGHRLRVLDDLSGGRRENLADVREDVELLRGNCADMETARRAARGVEVVYHQAAVPSVARSVDDPALSHRANATATLTMLVAARDAGVRRFVYAGSSSVYGDTPQLPKSEDMAPRPRSPYAVGKLMGEHYLRIFHELYGLETLTLRYFNVYGPRQSASSPYSGVISLFVTALLAGRRPVLYGNGEQSRDFTYVEDVVQGNLRALRARGLAGQHVNVATGHRVTLRELLRTIARELGVPARAERKPPRKGDVRHSLADISAARRLLGYRPRVDLETGLRHTVQWYRDTSGARR